MRNLSSLRQIGPGLALAGLLVLVGPAARADSILLRGGERLIGKVLAEEPDKIRFESQALGVLEISRDRVERIERDAPPPPPVAAGPVVPAAAVAEKESIVPAPPPVVAAKSAIVPTPPPENTPSPAPAGMNPTAEQSAGPVVASAPAPAVGPSAAPVVVSDKPVTAAPAAAPVFYPWSGLKTEHDTFDWIQLTSGEWLKGKIKGLQNYELDFDSEKMDLKTFDWKDIVIVRSPRLNNVWFGEEGTAAGSLLVTADKVQVISTSGTTVFSRADLLAITPTGSKERSNWSGKLAFGLSLRSGNTQETSYNATATLQRRTPLTRLKLDYIGNYTDINGVTSEENRRLTAQFDYFFSRRLYVRFPDAEYYRDPVQNIKDRYTLGGAVGYDLYRTRDFEWDVSAGPAYQRTEFISVEAGKDSIESAFAGVFSTHLDWQATQRIEWIFDYRSQVTGKSSSGGNTQHANSTVEFKIHKRLKLDISFIWDRVGDPKADSSGTVPKADDYRLNTSLGVDF